MEAVASARGELAIRTALWPDSKKSGGSPSARIHELREHGNLSRCRCANSCRRDPGHHQPPLAYHAQIWFRHQCGAEPHAQPDGLRTLWMEQRQKDRTSTRLNSSHLGISY